MSFSLADATALTAVPGAILAVLAWRTRGAKRDALEKLVAEAVKAKDQDHKDEIARIREEIARNDNAHREQVEWLQSQILYYQQMSAPRMGQRPNHPPVDQ